MCDFNKGFILCKCNTPKVVVHNKKSRRNKNTYQEPIEYIWTLYKYLGASERVERGRYMFPVNDIGNGLSADFVIEELNDRNCFDFEYQPNEGDNLIISKSKSPSRIEFIFKEGKWIKDHYSPFDHECEEIDNGKIKEVE